MSLYGVISLSTFCREQSNSFASRKEVCEECLRLVYRETFWKDTSFRLYSVEFIVTLVTDSRTSARFVVCQTVAQNGGKVCERRRNTCCNKPIYSWNNFAALAYSNAGAVFLILLRWVIIFWWCKDIDCPYTNICIKEVLVRRKWNKKLRVSESSNSFRASRSTADHKSFPILNFGKEMVCEWWWKILLIDQIAEVNKTIKWNK